MEELERARFRARIAGTPLRQHEIAKAMGKTEAWLSKILNGQVPMPADFEMRLEAGIKAAAEKAAKALLDAAEPKEVPTAAAA